MTITFDRPVGPKADVNELEYISALHQTTAFSPTTMTPAYEDEDDYYYYEQQQSSTSKRRSRPTASLRQDSSIRAIDISRYLSSRHAIRVEEEIVRTRIFQELCGIWWWDDNNNNNEQEMDLCHMVALLLIPFFRKEKEEADKHMMKKGRIRKVGEDKTLPTASISMTANAILTEDNIITTSPIELVFEILINHMKEHLYHDYREHKGGIALTPKVLQNIFRSYGEPTLPDSLLKEMIMLAGGNQYGVVFTPQRFLRGLTMDVLMYQQPSNNPNKPPTTYYQDATHKPPSPPLAGKPTTTTTAANNNSNNKSGSVVSAISSSSTSTAKSRTAGDNGAFVNEKFGKLLVKQFYAAPSVDVTADTYRSRLWIVLLWIFLLTSYLSYFFGEVSIVITYRLLPCDTSNTNGWGCLIGQGVVLWIEFFVVFTILGYLLIYLSSLGNEIVTPQKKKSKINASIEILVGIFILFLICILPFNILGPLRETTTTNDDTTTILSVAVAGQYLAFLLGWIIMVLQLYRLVLVWLPPQLSSSSSTCMNPDGHAEQSSKHAATKKVNWMVKHALMTHYAPPTSLRLQMSSPRNASFTSPALFDAALASHVYHPPNNGKSSSWSSCFVHYRALEHIKEPTGGIPWAWSKVWNRSLSSEEGIWIPSRIFAMQTMQLLVLLGFLLAFVGSIQYAHHTFVEEPENENDGFATSRHLEPLASEYARQAQNGLSFLNNRTNATTTTTNNNNTTTTGIFVFTLEQIANIVNDTDVLIKGAFQNEAFLTTVVTRATTFFVNVSSGSLFTNATTKVVAFYNSTDDTVDSNFSSTAAFYYNTSDGTYFFYTDPEEEEEDGSIYLRLSNLFELWELYAALSIGFVAAFMAVLGIITVFVPSFISTVLKFRSGALPSLRDPSFCRNFHTSLETSTALLGSAFWGTFFTGIVCWFLIGFLTLFCVWSGTRKYAIMLLSHIIGITLVTIQVKVITLLILDHKSFSDSFYRKKPFAANLLNVALESWNLALSLGSMALRSISLLLIAAMHIGRIDTPLLAPGIENFGSTTLDYMPMNFKKDILLHEAHRHPYIERIGLMYLMKLRHGENFGHRAGACWRLLFVLTLMPWMRSYRRRPSSLGNKGIEQFFDEDEEAMGARPGRRDRNANNMELEVLQKENAYLKQQIAKVLQGQQPANEMNIGQHHTLPEDYTPAVSKPQGGQEEGTPLNVATPTAVLTEEEKELKEKAENALRELEKLEMERKEKELKEIQAKAAAALELLKEKETKEEKEQREQKEKELLEQKEKELLEQKQKEKELLEQKEKELLEQKEKELLEQKQKALLEQKEKEQKEKEQKDREQKEKELREQQAKAFMEQQEKAFKEQEAKDFLAQQEKAFMEQMQQEAPAMDYAAAPAMNYAAEPAMDYAAEPAMDYAAEPAIDYAAEPAMDYADGDGYPPVEETPGADDYAANPELDEEEAAKSSGPEAVEQQLLDMCDAYVETQDGTEPNLDAFNACLLMWAESGARQAPARAEELVQRMYYYHDNNLLSDVRPDLTTFNTLLLCYANTSSGSPVGFGERTTAILREMEANEAYPTYDSYFSVILASGNSGDPEDAQKALDEMSNLYLQGYDDIRPDVQLFNIVLSSWANSGRPDAAEKAQSTLKLMQDLHASGILESEPDLETYNIALECWAGSEDDDAAESAEAILLDMEANDVDHEIQPNTASYNSVIKSWAYSNSADAGVRAEEVLQRMLSRFYDGDVSTRPDKASFLGVVNAWMSSGAPDASEHASKVQAQMQQEFPDLL